MGWVLNGENATWTTPMQRTSIRLAEGPSWVVESGEYPGKPESRCNAKISASDSDEKTTRNHSLPLGDHYLRQHDLIAIYPQASPLRFGYEVYFCAIPEAKPHASVLELWLSVQTSTLESFPQIQLDVTGEAWDPIIDSESLGKLIVSSDRKRGWLIHPLDRNDCNIELHSNGFTARVFDRFMEKGVIRRMRMRWLVSERALSTTDWQSAMASFAQTPLPLTA
jgi:hypothetical protein